MPEAPVYQNYRLVSAQGDVRTAGQSSSMKPEPVTGCMKPPAHDQFRARVGSADARHVGTALRGTQRVGHRPPVASESLPWL